MAYRKRMRRARRKRRFIRRRRVSRRQKDNGIRFFKIRFMADLTNSVTGYGVIDAPLASGTDFGAVSELFGYYRTHAMKIKYVPRHNTAPTNVTQVMTPILVWHDWDMLNAPNRIDLAGMETCKFKDPAKPWSVYYRMKKMISAPAAVLTHDNRFYQPTTSPNATQRVIINAGGNAVSIVGTLYITLYIAAKQRL
ncbi:MAG: capsid protein [Fish-associated circovirus]|nr:MAG: capsid protein [Fish-associated circovirus]